MINEFCFFGDGENIWLIGLSKMSDMIGNRACTCWFSVKDKTLQLIGSFIVLKRISKREDFYYSKDFLVESKSNWITFKVRFISKEPEKFLMPVILLNSILNFIN